MRSIRKIKNLKGKVVLVRVDFNVPLKDGMVEDDFRIRKALPTINLLRKAGAKVILITHLGKGGETLTGVATALNKLVKAKFIPEVYGPNVLDAVKQMKSGDVLLLENLRNDPREQECDKVFAKQLASMADIYVNEAFPVSHRKDASIVLLPKLLPSHAGLQLSLESENLSLAFKKPKHPFIFILGGAKFSTKMPLVKKYLKLADRVFIGGALANDFFKEQGFEVGRSLVDGSSHDIEKILKNKKLILPTDVVVESGGQIRNKKLNEVATEDNIIDVGVESVKNLILILKTSKLVLWNGPLGVYESGGAKASENILKSLASIKTVSIVGGGDTAALVSKLKIEKKLSFVSTGGGASLDFLANGSLPGIKALR